MRLQRHEHTGRQDEHGHDVAEHAARQDQEQYGADDAAGDRAGSEDHEAGALAAQLRRYATAPLSEPGTSPTVLLTLATTGENPNASRVGKVMSDPEPTMVLIVPATSPTPVMARASSTDMRRVYRSVRGASTLRGEVGGR